MSGSGSYSNNNSGVSATASGDRTVDRTTSVNSGCGSSNSGGGGGSNNNSGGSGLELRQQSQRNSSSRVDYRATERTANSDVLRNVYSDVAAVVAAVPSGSNRSSCLTPLSPSDSERGNHGHGHDGGIVISNGIARSLNDVHGDRRDRSDRNRGAREERNRERESRNRSSTVSDATIYGETSNSAHTYVDNANGTAMISLSTDGFERLRSTGQYLDYRT